METILNSSERAKRRHLVLEVKASLREVRNQLSLLNRQVGSRIELRDIDLDTVDLLSQAGPLSPSVLARRLGQHPATVTGIVDRLERDGWVTRERAADDRRAVLVRAVPERNSEVLEQYAGMNDSMDGLLADYSEEQLQTIAAFLRASAEAGAAATEALQRA
jgi:DNA-binding MarR family transcriptional regulator